MYSISCSGPRGTIKVISRRLALTILCALLTCGLVAPVLAGVSADVTLPKSQDTLAQDNPELIAVIKTHIAYVGQAQDARMDGVISYIDTISDGTGSGTLQEIQEDYLVVASSIPVMQTANDIAEARVDLQRQSRLFAEETKMQLVLFNGSTDTMRQTASASVQAAEDSITNLGESLWLSRDSARLMVFNRESRQRTAMLRSLSRQGVDISRAQNISEQIDARRIDLQNALTEKSISSLKETNAVIKTLNREFRADVDEYQTELRIDRKREAILAMK